MPYLKILNYDLPGVKVLLLDKYVDERGFFMEAFREDWRDFTEKDGIVQVNFSMTRPGIVKAWHRHLRGQVDYFMVLKGALKICAYDEETKALDEIIASEDKPCIVRIPGHYWHGVKTVGNEPAYYVYFVNRLYDYKNPDELRRPWNDPKVVPRKINGKETDPRVGKPWNWLEVVFKRSPRRDLFLGLV